MSLFIININFFKGVYMEQEKLAEMIKSLIEKDKENFIKKQKKGGKGWLIKELL